MTIKFGNWFVFEVACGGVYAKAGMRELFYSREQGLSLD